MASGPITLWQIGGKTMEKVTDFILGDSKVTADGDYTHEIKRHLLLGRKVMTNLDSLLKNRDITLPTKVRLVKAMVFPVVMYGCEKWSEVAQWCPTLCDPMHYSLSGSSIHGIFQARVLEWIAISFSRGSSRPRNRPRVSPIAGRHFIVWARTQWMWELDYKEIWAPKNWCFWTMVLEKTLESLGQQGDPTSPS